MSLSQMGVVEIHTWNSTADDVERPNRIVWDLNPGPEVLWKQIVKAAELSAKCSTTLGLASWVKTTGGRGSMSSSRSNGSARRRNASTLRALSAKLSREPTHRPLRQSSPRLAASEKILIDYLRNNRTNTSVSAFSPRARPRSARCPCRSAGTRCASRPRAGHF